MLTKKQSELLQFIHERLSQGGVSPSFDEMKEALKLRSKSGIHRLITALEERGFIRRLPHRARALEVLRPPQMPEAAGAGTDTALPFRPTVMRSGDRLPSANRPGPAGDSGVVQLPLYGRIAAGHPIEAISDATQYKIGRAHV